MHVEQNKLTPVQRHLSMTQDHPHRYIPIGLGLTLKMKVRRQDILLCHSLFHLVSTQHATLMSDL